MRRFVRGDLAGALQRAGDVVQAVDERLLRVRVELELEREPAGMGDPQLLEVDRQLVRRGERLAQRGDLAPQGAARARGRC